VFYLNTEKYKAKPLFYFGKESVCVVKTPYLGRSYQSKRPVLEMLNEAFPKTALLAVISIIFAILLGIGVGTLCAVFKDSWFDVWRLFSPLWAWHCLRFLPLFYLLGYLRFCCPISRV
jgi:ABC-type dipeptide/oligopeptide/nickel transport system permease component